jgi:hypothetical protein
MSGGFSSEIAGFYAKYRRGYEPGVIDWLTQTFGLDGHGIVLDPGCGTHHLAIPPAARSRAVVPAALLGP